MSNKRLTIIVSSTIAAALATGVIIYLVRRQQEQKRMTRVSEEGYETAEDILYPLRNRRRKWQFDR